jgi:hypothetical protein
MNSPETFQQEFNAALRRYLQKPGRSDIQLTHRQTGEPLDYHQEFPDLFQNWLPVRSSWDRRSLIYRDVLDRILQNQIQSWGSIPGWTLSINTQVNILGKRQKKR